MILIEFCCADGIGVQYIAALVAHNHVQTEQLVACIDLCRRLQLHLTHLVQRQITGNQCSSIVIQLVHLATYHLKAGVCALRKERDLDLIDKQNKSHPPLTKK